MDEPGAPRQPQLRIITDATKPLDPLAIEEQQESLDQSILPDTTSRITALRNVTIRNIAILLAIIVISLVGFGLGYILFVNSSLFRMIIDLHDVRI